MEKRIKCALLLLGRVKRLLKLGSNWRWFSGNFNIEIDGHESCQPVKCEEMHKTCIVLTSYMAKHCYRLLLLLASIAVQCPILCRHQREDPSHMNLLDAISRWVV